MASFFSSIADFLASIVHFVSSLVEGILGLLNIFVSGQTALNSFLVYLPAEIALFASAFIIGALVLHFISLL